MMCFEASEIMPGAEDREVLAKAYAEARVLLTNDKDFGEMAFRSRLPHRGIVLFRLADEHAKNRVRMARLAVEKYGDRPEDAFVVVTEQGVRIRGK